MHCLLRLITIALICHQINTTKNGDGTNRIISAIAQRSKNITGERLDSLQHILSFTEIPSVRRMYKQLFESTNISITDVIQSFKHFEPVLQLQACSYCAEEDEEHRCVGYVSEPNPLLQFYNAANDTIMVRGQLRDNSTLLTLPFLCIKIRTQLTIKFIQRTEICPVMKHFLVILFNSDGSFRCAGINREPDHETWGPGYFGKQNWHDIIKIMHGDTYFIEFGAGPGEDPYGWHSVFKVGCKVGAKVEKRPDPYGWLQQIFNLTVKFRKFKGFFG